MLKFQNLLQFAVSMTIALTSGIERTCRRLSFFGVASNHIGIVCVSLTMQLTREGMITGRSANRRQEVALEEMSEGGNERGCLSLY